MAKEIRLFASIRFEFHKKEVILMCSCEMVLLQNGWLGDFVSVESGGVR